MLQKRKNTSKVILGAPYSGSYSPTSELRDLLQDYGIDTEVFSTPRIRTGKMTREAYLDGVQTEALVLRADDPDAFVVVDSTNDGHNHLYIQQEFSAGDHKTLIQELGALGIVSPS